MRKGRRLGTEWRLVNFFAKFLHAAETRQGQTLE